MTKTARLIIEVETLEQAKGLADWFDGQGEQDAIVWMDELGLKTPMTKKVKVFKDKNEVIIETE